MFTEAQGSAATYTEEQEWVADSATASYSATAHEASETPKMTLETALKRPKTTPHRFTETPMTVSAAVTRARHAITQPQDNFNDRRRHRSFWGSPEW